MTQVGVAKQDLPSYAYTSAMTLKAYMYATEHPEILEQISCYCGCQHDNLRECFINDEGQYDEHASYCDACLGETVKAQQYLSEGKTLNETIYLIDVEYGRMDNFTIEQRRIALRTQTPTPISAGSSAGSSVSTPIYTPTQTPIHTPTKTPTIQSSPCKDDKPSLYGFGRCVGYWSAETFDGIMHGMWDWFGQ